MKFAVYAFALLLLAGNVRDASAQTVGEERLTGIAKRFFADYWRLEPGRATLAGVHDYDDTLGDYSANGFSQRVGMYRRFLAETQAIDPTQLGADASYDREILRGKLSAGLLSLTARERWQHDPGFYARTASTAINALLTRDFAPLPERARSVIAREREIPDLLAEARKNVTTVDAATAEVSAADIAGTIDFFSATVPAALAALKDRELVRQFSVANAAALDALHAYDAAMRAGPLAQPSGTFAVGPQTFEQLLALQELSPISLADYERAGVAELARNKADFDAAAARVAPGKPPEAALAELTPASEPRAVVAQAAAVVPELRRFVIAHHLLSLAPADPVQVVQEPGFMHAGAPAAMSLPGPFATKASGIYFELAPPPSGAERTAQYLAYFNTYALPIVAIHEVMPGHYANWAIEKQEKLSLVRRAVQSPSFAEGWAHYDEELMVDEGWGGGDPRVRLAQVRFALERTCRMLVSLREHTRGMTVDQATKFFVDNAFLPADRARSEALSATQDPLLGGNYTLGKLELLKLRADYQKRQVDKFELGAFHDALLAHGDPPFAIVRKLLLGADDDGRLLGR